LWYAQQKDNVKINLKWIQRDDIKKELPKFRTSARVSNLIRVMTTPEKTSMSLNTKTGIGAPVIANSPNMGKNRGKTNMSRGFFIYKNNAIHST